jgi:very-short-patch-repair endonuclease
MVPEHASAAIDSVLHERVLTRREVDAVIAALPAPAAGLIDEFTGRTESGAESLFVRRLAAHGFHVVTQVPLGGFGRYDGMIDGCVLFEIDGRGFHSGSGEFFADRDRTLVAQVFGVPVVRPSARHVLEDWPVVLAAVTRTVEDAKLVRRGRGLPPVIC